MVARLKQILLPAQGLRHNRPGSSQARRGDEVVIVQLCGLCFAMRCERGHLPQRVDRLHTPLEHADVGRPQRRNVVVLDPALSGEFLGCQRQRGADRVVWGVSKTACCWWTGHSQKPSRSSTMVMSSANRGFSTCSPSSGVSPQRGGRPRQRSWRLRAAERPPYAPPTTSTLVGSGSGMEPIVDDGI